MGKFIDLTGQRFGRWLVLRRILDIPVTWQCQCDCGVVKKVLSQSLRRGMSTSCGCYHDEELSKKFALLRLNLKEKYCPQCIKNLPIENFGTDKSRKTGICCWCNSCLKIYLKKNRDKYLSKKRESSKESRRLLRLEVLTRYSSGKIVCSCCGENHLEFLSIDHINGGGAAHRRKIGRGKIYLWLRNNNFPDGFRVLCHNCNQALGAYGYCPHTGPRPAEDH